MRNIICSPTWICLTWIHLFGFGVTGQTLSGKRYTGTSELLFYSAETTFNDAMEYCRNHNSVLVKVSNININNAIYDFNKDNWNTWGIQIGATRNASTWQWVAGGNIGYNNWATGEPDNGNDNDCAYMKDDGKWNDIPCVLKINFVCQKAFNIQTVYLWGVHTFTFHVLHEERKTFAGAMQSCAAKDLRLVEIPTTNNNEYLKQRMQTFSGINVAWSGGSDLNRTNIWLWNDRIHINTSSTKWGWRSNEPNGAGEHCLAVSKTGWVDFACNARIAYICEQVQVSVVHPSSADFTVSAGGGYEITCDLRGIYPQPTVSWYYEGQVVAGYSTTHSIYQTKRQGYATLNTQHATITDEGSYTCQATNTIGNTLYTASGTSTVQVPSRPSIHSVTTNSCRLQITWAPNKRAVGVGHRITVSNGSDNFASMVTPTTINATTYVIRKLGSSTSYIQITPCPKGCKVEYSASQHVVTRGPPGNVRDASVFKTGPSSCDMTWKSASGTPTDPITGHKIYIRESIASLATTSLDNNIVEETRSIDSNSTYLFHGKPNRKYSFGIQAVTCVGAGPVSNVTGTCTTNKQAPFEVAQPIVSGAIDKEGKVNLSVPIPDQKNGPLSCLFVMVRPKGFATGYLPNSLNQLQTANESSQGSEYIAVAISATRLTGISKNITLGDGVETSCNVHFISSRKRRSANEDGMFVGRNKKLDPKNEYNVYAVSTTPSGGKVFVKSSEIQNLQSKSEYIDTPPGLSTTTVIMIASIVGGLLLITIIIGIVIFVKRRKQNANAGNQQQSNEHEYEYPAIPMGLQEQPGYEVVGQNYAQRRIGVPEDSAYETYDDQQPHPGSERRAEAASPPSGEGGYEVPMSQYAEIK